MPTAPLSETADRIAAADAILATKLDDALSAFFARRLITKNDEVAIDADDLVTTLANLLASSGAAAAITAKIGGTNQTLTALTGNIAFVKETAHSITINTSTTNATAGGALTINAATGLTTGAGGAFTLKAGTGGNDAVGGAMTLAGGAAGGGNRAGGAMSLAGGAGAGTGAGAAITITGGASGAGATGKGGAVTITGGAAASTNDDGGTLILAPGAKAGTGINGLVRISGVAVWNLTPTTITDTATLTVAQLKSGTIKATPTAAASYTMPTGAVLQAALPTSLAVGDSFEFTLVNVATNDTFDITLVTAASGITLYGNVTCEANSAVTKASSATFRVVCTSVVASTGTFDVYRIS